MHKHLAFAEMCQHMKVALSVDMTHKQVHILLWVRTWNLDDFVFWVDLNSRNLFATNQFAVQWRGCGASLIWEDILLSAAHVSHSLADDTLATTLSLYVPDFAHLLQCNGISSTYVLVGAFHQSIEWLPLVVVTQTSIAILLRMTFWY
jgi:hypothetical protein